MKIIDKTSNLFRSYSDLLLKILSLTAVVSVLLLRLVFLNRGLIFSDEGWYLCLMRDLPLFGSTQYHLLFKNVFNNNIYAIRLACYLLMLASSLVFAAGLYSYLKKVLTKSYSFIYCLGIVYLGQMSLLSCPSFNYITLNITIVEFAIGFLLLGLSNNNVWFYLLSGFFVGFLFPVMITNVVTIPVLLIVLFCLSDKKWNNSMVFVLGILLFFLFYFTIIESPTVYFDSFINETKKTVGNGSSSYGVMFLIKWLYKASLYVIKQAVVALVLVFCLRNTKKHTIKFKWLYVVLSIVVVIYFAVYLYPLSYGWTWKTDIYWIVVFFLLFDKNYFPNKQTLLIAFLLLLQPVCLSFGTNVPFQLRQSSYFAFLTPLIFLVPKQSIRVKNVLFLLFLYFWLTFVFSVFKPNWHGDKILEQTKSLTEVGINQNIKLDDKHCSMVVFCNDKIKSGDRLFVYHKDYWGIAALLDVYPISHEYDPSEKDSSFTSNVINETLKKHNEPISVVLNKDQKESFMSIIHNEDYLIEDYTFDEVSIIRLSVK